MPNKTSAQTVTNLIRYIELPTPPFLAPESNLHTMADDLSDQLHSVNSVEDEFSDAQVEEHYRDLAKLQQGFSPRKHSHRQSSMLLVSSTTLQNTIIPRMKSWLTAIGNAPLGKSDTPVYEQLSTEIAILSAFGGFDDAPVEHVLSYTQAETIDSDFGDTLLRSKMFSPSRKNRHKHSSLPWGYSTTLQLKRNSLIHRLMQLSLSFEASSLRHINGLLLRYVSKWTAQYPVYLFECDRECADLQDRDSNDLNDPLDTERYTS